MLAYDGLGPNPRALRMFLAEKGIELPTREIDIMSAENRKPPYADRNPGGQVPALELDDGRVIGETVAIFEYLDEQHPEPALVGTTPEERAETRQWQRRVEFKITEPLYNGFRFAEGHELFKNRMRCLPEAAEGLKATSKDGQAWLDGLLQGRSWIVPDRFTIADVILYCALDFGASVGQPLDPKLGKLSAWFERVASRPSAKKSLHPASEKAGIRG